MALAILTTVSPEVGGVLVRGEKGTAKTTMVRALAQVLPSIAVVEAAASAATRWTPMRRARTVPMIIPWRALGQRGWLSFQWVLPKIGDRLARFAASLGVGEVVYEPGLLAAAHRGILYVDEVNAS